MSRARKLMESVQAMQMDEAIRPVKNGVREVLDKAKENGSKGARGLIEVAIETFDKMKDEQNDDAPNGATDKDKQVINQVLEVLGKLQKDVKGIKETAVGMTDVSSAKNKKKKK